MPLCHSWMGGSSPNVQFFGGFVICAKTQFPPFARLSQRVSCICIEISTLDLRLVGFIGGGSPFLGCQAILCSPLRRTLQTAALALAPHVERGVPWYGVEAAREFSQGQWQTGPNHSGGSWCWLLVGA